MGVGRVTEDLGHEVVSEVLLTSEQLRDKVAELGRLISEDHAGSEVWLISILKGGTFFLVDLARAISIPVAFDFFAISTYASRASSGSVRITKDLDDSIEGAHVIIVEDIIDTGLTLGYIRRNLLARNPASLKTCVLLDRPKRRMDDFPIEYRGFEVPDVFIVGYGLDWEQKYRNLPYVGIVKPELCDRAHMRLPWER